MDAPVPGCPERPGELAVTADPGRGFADLPRIISGSGSGGWHGSDGEDDVDDDDDVTVALIGRSCLEIDLESGPIPGMAAGGAARSPDPSCALLGRRTIFRVAATFLRGYGGEGGCQCSRVADVLSRGDEIWSVVRSSRGSGEVSEASGVSDGRAPGSCECSGVADLLSRGDEIRAIVRAARVCSSLTPRAYYDAWARDPGPRSQKRGSQIG